MQQETELNKVWQATIDSDPELEGWWSCPNELAGEALPTLMRKVIAQCR